MNKKSTLRWGVALMLLIGISVMTLAIQMHSAPKAYAYVDCSTTRWATVLGPGSGTSPDGNVHITAYLQEYQDARDFSYCGETRTYFTFSMPNGYCDTFYPSVEDKSGVLHGQTTNYVCATGGNGYSYNYAANSTGCAASYVKDYLYPGWHVSQGWFCPA